MADIHLDAAGSNTAPYDTWAKAATSFATAAAAATVAGDRILMGSAYNESVATVNLTLTNGVLLLSGTKDVTSGITALTAGSKISTTSFTYNINGSFYANGVTFESTSGSSHTIGFAKIAGNIAVLENCTTVHVGTGSSSGFQFGDSSAGVGYTTELRNHAFKCAHAGQKITLGGSIRVIGGAWASGGTAPTTIFDPSYASARGFDVYVEGYDFSNISSSANLMTAQGGAGAVFKNCTMPTGWTGAPIASGTVVAGQKVAMYGYKIGSTWYRTWTRDKLCDVTEENTIVKTGGSSDTAGYSLKMVTTATAAYPYAVACGPDLAVINTVTTGALTATVDIAHSGGAALTDGEVWLEVVEPDGTVTTDAKTNVLTTAAAQTTSAATWGGSPTYKQKLEVSFTPTKAGPVLCRVRLAKASTTIYIDAMPGVA